MSTHAMPRSASYADLSLRSSMGVTLPPVTAAASTAAHRTRRRTLLTIGFCALPPSPFRRAQRRL
jgi:hypothetical protein